MDRVSASRIGVLSLRLAVVGMVGWAFVLAGGAPARTATSEPSSGSFRLLFGSDWSGTTEIYAADPSGERSPAQLTFGRAPTCAQSGCGYADLGPSPDGRFILYTDFSGCDASSSRAALFVANADGSHVVVLARSAAPANCQGGIGASWAPDSRRVAYAVDGRVEIADVDGRNRRVVGRGDRAAWSPDDASIAFSTVGVSGAGPLSVWTNGRTRLLARAATGFRWSPDGRWLAYGFNDPSSQETTVIVHPDGRNGRRVVTGAVLQPSGWSPDGRFLTVWSSSGVAAVRVADGSLHPLGFSAALAWQPSGHVLAVTDERGTFVMDVATGASRLLTSEQAAGGAWSPDGGSFAYVWQSSPTYFGYSDLRVVTLAGVTRTLVQGGGAYGGYVGGLVWTRAPGTPHYRPAQPRVLAEVRDDGLTAPWPITRLASDGRRVAYVSCGHVFVWTPSDESIVQAEPSSSMSPRCTTPGNYLSFSLYTLALSGDQIAYGYREGNNGQQWGLYAGRIGDGTSLDSLDGVTSVGGCALGTFGLGDLTGAGGLLVFSTWRDDLGCPARTLEQQIFRVDGGACPCPLIAGSPGPLVPFDIDDGRIVAGGENATAVYDAAGTQLLSIPVSPLAAQLAGSDLVVLVRGQLLVYDAATGVQLHAWPLPDVPSGGECASPHYGTWECRDARLVLEDAADGLAAYVLDGQLHTVRLADGADQVIGAANLARFMNAGLVYADGPSLHLVPFDRLPLQQE